VPAFLIPIYSHIGPATAELPNAFRDINHQETRLPGILKPSGTTPDANKERPWIFALLIIPMAVLSNGVISGGLSFLLSKQGVDMARGASIISLLNLPQTIYFLWSPITDFWIRRRTWLMLAATTGAIGLVIVFHIPNLASPAAVATLFLSACFAQLVVAACGGIMGSLRSEAVRRRASSFYQGGSLAFGAAGIYVVATLADRMSLGHLGWVIAAMVALPSLAALAAPKQDVITAESASAIFKRIGREFKITFFRWKALPYIALVTFPMGSGAAIGLLPGLAVDYHVSGQQVAWMNGLAGSALTALGALVATLIPVRMRVSVSYPLVCLVNEVTLAVLWLGPLRPSTYFIGATLYLFTIGTCYAVFTAVVLEFLGNSGKSGSARYSIINSMGNLPPVYMLAVDGLGYGRWGTRGLPAADAVVGFVGGTVLLTYFLIQNRGTKDQPDNSVSINKLPG
jgi:PAT family beta-lactamase induction signal transducer AmpG